MIKKQVPKLSFDKELFKRSVLYNIKTLYRKTLEEATPQQIFQAVSYAVKDTIVNNWMDTQKEYEKEDLSDSMCNYGSGNGSYGYPFSPFPDPVPHRSCFRFR